MPLAVGPCGETFWSSVASKPGWCCDTWSPIPSPLSLQPVGAGCQVFKGRPKLAAWRQRVEAAVGEDLFREAHAVLMKAKDLPPADTAMKERLKPLAQLFL